MDELINGVFKSTHNEKTKKQIFKKMRISASNSLVKMNEIQRQNLLQICIHYFLYGTEFDCQEALSLLNSFLPICHEDSYQIFTDHFFGNIVLGKYFSQFSEAETENTSSHITIPISRRLWLIEMLLDTFDKKAMKKQHIYIQIHMKTEAIRLLYDCLDHKSFAQLSSFLLKHEDCLPPPTRFFAVCTVSIHAMSDFHPMESNVITVASYVNDITEISYLIRYIWNKEPATLMPSLKEIFNIISSHKGDLEPSNALGCLVEYIPSEMITDVIAQIVNDPTITDEQMMTALTRMISWVGWPRATLANLWVLNFFQQLENLSKYSMLIEVTIKTIKQVFKCLRFEYTRSSSLVLVIQMLLSFQSSAEAFHVIVPLIPQMFSSIETEPESESNKSCLLQLSNLCHCMMFLHSGFPELYGPILESIKNYPKPTEKEIKSALKLGAESALRHHRVFDHHDQLATRSLETGRAGLVNMGNTCYINSVIQALFMVNEFRSSILKLTPFAGSTIQALLETFAFLSLTQREAYEPKDLVEISRPSWFNPGSQQMRACCCGNATRHFPSELGSSGEKSGHFYSTQRDCSEYLKHLLDRLNEEEKALRQTPKIPTLSNQSGSSGTTQQVLEKDLSDAVSSSVTLIEDLFHGKLRSSIVCSSCSYQSSREETFVDIALPLNKAEERGGLTEAQNKNIQSISLHIDAADSTGSRAFVGNAGSDEPRRPVQVEDVEEEEEEVVQRSHKLEDLLHDSLAEERMSGDNQYHCSTCSALRDAVKTTHITSLPKYLIISLLRFTYSLAEQRRSKVLDNVKIAPQIEVPLYRGDASAPELQRYTLSSVVVHSGMSAESGHYYCCAKQSEDENDRWCLFNDNHVSLTTFQSIKNLTDQFSRDTAYVLFYARANNQSPKEDDRRCIDRRLRQKIEDDNLAFEKEVEEASKKRTEGSKTCPSNVLGWNDDNPPPPPTCGGGDGQPGPGFLVC